MTALGLTRSGRVERPAGSRVRKPTWRRGAPRWSIAVVLGAAALVLAPVMSLLCTAVGGGSDPSILARVLPSAALETLLLLAGVAAVTGAVGVGTAWLVTAYRFPGRGALVWLLPLPLAVPTYITAYIYVEIFDAAGPVQSALRELFGLTGRIAWFPEVRSLGGCVLVMSAVLYPYVYIAARTMFATQSGCLIDCARTLGAGRLALLRTVIVPLARPALAVGLSLALLEALNDIGAAEYLGVRTLTLSVYTTWLNRGSLPDAAQIACLMLALVAGLLYLERRGRTFRRYALPSRRGRLASPLPLRGLAGTVALIVCATPVLLGLGLPLAFLVREALRQDFWGTLDLQLAQALGHTLLLAGAATLATLVLGLVVVTAARLARHRLTEGVKQVLVLGYALPGTVLALGLLAPLVAVDNLLNAVSSALDGPRLGLLLMGSGAGLVLAYAIRFLPIATGSMAAGLDRVSPSLEDAARTLGARPREMVLRVQLPLVTPALAGAAILVFVDAIKELPATLLLRPLNTETLATLVYGAAARGSFEQGSLAALVIVLVGLWPVIRLTRVGDAPPVARPDPADIVRGRGSP